MEAVAVEMNCGTLSDTVFEHALSKPDALALVQREIRLSYATLAGLIGRASAHLHGLGVRPGEVVAVGLGFGVDALVLTMALLRLGAVPIDIAGIRQAGLEAAITRFVVRRVLAPVMVALPEGSICHVVDAGFHAAVAGASGDRRTTRDPAAAHLLHLARDRHGGPKAIAVTQHQILARMRSTRLLFPAWFTPQELPMLLLVGEMGFAGMTLLATQFARGGPVGLLPADPDAGRMARLIGGAGDTVCLVSAAQCRRLLEVAPADGWLFPRLRGLIHGARVLSAGEEAEIGRRLAANVWSTHGSAATGFVAAAMPGPCAPGLWAEAADGAGQVVPPGMVGHLRFRGPGVSLGLYRATAEEQVAEGFRGGWLMSGDVGSVAVDGTLLVTGHAGDLLRRRGIDLFLPQIEDALRAHPTSADAAVVGVMVPDGKDPLLIGFVVPREAPDLAGTPDLSGLARHCASLLAPARRPDRLAFIKELPRLADGRVDRRRLAAMAVRGEAPKPDAPLSAEAPRA